ncbi:type I methionyl aminopeptidase [Candidatus Babeliales bacterium]|nr:type I methionyl aminopeptidase [Candidatus Babeliales bacterium]
MVLIKNKSAIEKMHIAGKLLAQILHEVKSHVVKGATTLQIDNFIENRMKDLGLKAECKGYAGYKYATCISLNDVIVHGVPSDKIVLKSGDFVKIDVVGSYKNYCVDMARFFFVGNVGPVVKKIAQVSQNALDKAIELVVEGNRLSDISFGIQKEVEKEGFNVIRKFAGHGIGKDMHEEPDIPNYGKAGCGPVLREGMTLAIEPMISERSYLVEVMEDGWTAKTADGGLAGHVEDTVLVTNNGPQILTRI